MAFKKLTKSGENFITTICSNGDNNLLTGSNNYKLLFSSNPANKLYVASPKDKNGNTITTNIELGVSLIEWFNDYSKLFELDANIIAAQAFIESKYVLWAFPEPKYNSSAQGITQILSSTLFDVAIANKGASTSSSILFTSEEIEKLTKGLVEPRQLSSYVYVDNGGGSETANNNRIQLFQNCMDNPDLMIKAQCRLIQGISFAAANNAASTLFAYNQGFSDVKSTFTSTLKNAEAKLPLDSYNKGVEYINRIFRVLGDKNNGNHKPSGIWFNYDIDFTFDEFQADVLTSGSDINNVDKSTSLSKNYVLGDLITTSRGEINIPTKKDFDKLKIFANTILEPLNTYFNTIFMVNSSYRSEAVNSGVGGVVSSQHRLAEAADIRVNTEDKQKLFEIYKEIISGSSSNNFKNVVPFDQLIYETKGDTIPQKWIHISYKSENPSANRRETLLATLINDSMEYEKYSII